MWARTIGSAAIASFIACTQKVRVRYSNLDKSTRGANDVVNRKNGQSDLMFHFKRIHSCVRTAVVFDEAGDVAVLLSVDAHVEEDEGLLAVLL